MKMKGMTVGELRRLLASYPDDTPVFRAGMDGVDLVALEAPVEITVAAVKGGSPSGTHRQTPPSKGGKPAIQLGASY